MKREPNRSEKRVREEQPPAQPQGVSRRIVVVPSEDHSIYEKVIYVVRDEAAERGVTAQDVLREAQGILTQEHSVYGDPMEASDLDEETDAEHVSRILFALSGVALALSGGILVYWFFAI